MAREKLDWTILPQEFRYLVSPAEKYGHFQFDDRIFEFLQNGMTEEDKKELIDVNDRMSKEWTDIDRWLDVHMPHRRAAALVYFLGHLTALGVEHGYL